MNSKLINDWLLHGIPFGENKKLEPTKVAKDDSPNEKMVSLNDGTKKYHHELNIGDNILKGNQTYKIVHKDEKGYLTENTKTGDWYYTFSYDYDKDFKHNKYDRNKKAEKGDIVTFEHNGRKLEREVEENHNDGAVVRINKGDYPVLVKHGYYNFTGKKSGIVKLDK
ncbi:MAG: hypothetical protein NTY74_04445 [Ignavibacteriae bacterium]|nr:hypothetical protein [Ignavibacteriota bacterium]